MLKKQMLQSLENIFSEELSFIKQNSFLITKDDLYLIDGEYMGFVYMTNISMFVEFLKYKSFMSKTNLVKIDERHTTQINSLTGKLFKNKIELSDRTVKLSEDIEIDRDLNSAINILERYFNNHLAQMAEPLDKTNVIRDFNVMNKPSLIMKPISL